MRNEALEKEFKQFYKDSAGIPVLPSGFSDYEFISYLEDSPQKKNLLLKSKKTGQKVVLKYASGDYVSMLRTESISHTLGKFSFFPYVFDYEETPEGAWLLREYIEGESLAEKIENAGPISLTEAVKISVRLCGHLKMLHDSTPSIIYRDLKPANIVINDSGDIYLIDTGSIRPYREDSASDTVCIGTPETAAPEQFGARQTDRRTDIYGLGVLFHYLLTGNLSLDKLKEEKLPRKVVSIIKKCTAFNPESRYHDIGKVQAALNRLIPTGKLYLTRLAAAFSLCAFTAALILLFNSLSLSSRKEVVFSSPLLEQAVREELDIPDGNPVYRQDLSRITQILICGNTVFHNRDEHEYFLEDHSVNGKASEYGSIIDISILADMPDLRYVVLDHQLINDISPLKDLSLIQLSLCDNPVTDLSALKNLSLLQTLNLYKTNITSLEPLRDASGLTELDCSYTRITTLEPLSGLSLNTLYMVGVPASDVEALSNLPLTRLVLYQIPFDKLPVIADIPTLENLTLYDCGITSLSEIPEMEQLDSLDIYSNGLTDLTGVERFQNLTGLCIGDNSITDFTPLVSLKKLTYLDMAGAGNTDFKFLNQMPKLKGILVNEDQLDALYKAFPKPWFEVNYR